MIECEFENGGKGNLRHVTVNTITLNSKKEILLVKRASHLMEGGKYGLPGGFMDRDETAEGCALRELSEETGLRGNVIFLLRVNDNPQRIREDRQNVNFVYVVKVFEGKIEMDSEGTEAIWFSPEDLPRPDEIAFDHGESISMYIKHLKEPYKLPIIG